MRSIFITGAGAGIGRATASLFSARGYFCGLYDIDRKALDETKEILASKHTTDGVLDVTSADSFATAMREFGEKSGQKLDVMFNCAGLLRTGNFVDISPKEDAKQIDVNIHGVLNGTRAAISLLEKGERARIVNMSSASAVHGVPDMAVYSATKFFVRGLTEALDLELAPRGIRVCDVMPGYVATGMVSSQSFKPKSMDTLGVKLKAEDVAKRVWDAAHGNGVHYFCQTDVALLNSIGNVFGLGRRIMKYYAKK